MTDDRRGESVEWPGFSRMSVFTTARRSGKEALMALMLDEVRRTGQVVIWRGLCRSVYVTESAMTNVAVAR